MSVGRKNDSDKPDLSIVPRCALDAMARAFTFGANKYSRGNFKNGLAYTRLIAASLRHITSYNEGESFDKESALCHIDHALASLAMLKYMIDNKPELDDRDTTVASREKK